MSGTVHCTPRPLQTERSNLPDLPAAARNRSNSAEVEFYADFYLSSGAVLSNIMLDKADYLRRFKIPEEAHNQLNYTVTSPTCKVLKASNEDVKEFLIFQARDAEEKVIDHFLSSTIPNYDNSSKKARLNLVQAFELLDVASGVTILQEGERNTKAFLIMEGECRLTKKVSIVEDYGARSRQTEAQTK